MTLLLCLWCIWTSTIAYSVQIKSIELCRNARASYMSLSEGPSEDGLPGGDEDESELAEMLLDMYRKGLIRNPTEDDGYAEDEEYGGDEYGSEEERRVYTGKPRQVIKVSDVELERAREALAAKKIAQDHLNEGSILSADELIALMEEDPLLTESVDLDSLKGIIGLTDDIEDVPDDIAGLSQQLNAAFESAAIMNDEDTEGCVPKEYVGKNTFPSLYDDDDEDSPEVALRRMNEVDLFADDDDADSSGNLLNIDEDDDDYEDYEEADLEEADLEVLKERLSRDPSEQGDLDLGNMLLAKGMLSQLLDTMGDPDDLSKMQAEMRDKSERQATTRPVEIKKKQASNKRDIKKKTKTGVDLDGDIRNILDYIDDGLDVGGLDASTAYVMKKMKGSSGGESKLDQASTSRGFQSKGSDAAAMSPDVLKLMRKVVEATGRTDLHDEGVDLSGSGEGMSEDEVEVERVQVVDLTEVERKERLRDMLAEVAHFKEKMSSTSTLKATKGKATKKKRSD